VPCWRGKGLDKNFTPAPAERLGGFPDSLFSPSARNTSIVRAPRPTGRGWIAVPGCRSMSRYGICCCARRARSRGRLVRHQQSKPEQRHLPLLFFLSALHIFLHSLKFLSYYNYKRDAERSQPQSCGPLQKELQCVMTQTPGRRERKSSRHGRRSQEWL